MNLLSGGNKSKPRVDPTPPSVDTPEYREAQKAVSAADRWLNAVMQDADRVFSPHRRKPRPR